MSKNENNIMSVVIFVGLILYFGSSISFKPYIEKTVYNETCFDTKSNVSDCKPAMLAFSKTHYRVYPERQFVVSEVNGFVTKYQDCKVYDGDNWSCKISDKEVINDINGDGIIFFDTTSSKIENDYSLHPWYVVWLVKRLWNYFAQIMN